jgi:hypothetical protein
MTATGKSRIMIFGSKYDGSYVVEFRTAAGDTLAITIPRNETAVIRHFKERMPYGLFVPEMIGEQQGRPKCTAIAWPTAPVPNDPFVPQPRFGGAFLLRHAMIRAGRNARMNQLGDESSRHSPRW